MTESIIAITIVARWSFTLPSLINTMEMSRTTATMALIPAWSGGKKDVVQPSGSGNLIFCINTTNKSTAADRIHAAMPSFLESASFGLRLSHELRDEDIGCWEIYFLESSWRMRLNSSALVF